MAALASAVEVADVRVAFGGVVALAGVTMAVPKATRVGVIGANGAGKSVLFDVISGFTRPTSGTVHFQGQDVTRASAAGRARMGLRRTFQNAELFDDLTVWENVAVGAGSRSRSDVLTRIREAGLEGWGDQLARDVPAGLRRRVDFTRAIAGEPLVLLLDEPAAGLSGSEVDSLADALLASCENSDISVLLVEHDMALIRRVCEHTVVLDFGQVIAEGTPSEISSSRVVQLAYLGS